MAVQYEYLRDGEIHGPVTFRDLVLQVREGNLKTDDLVKVDREEQWTPAATVDGLFHMAGQADILAVWEKEREKKQRITTLKNESHEAEIAEKKRISNRLPAVSDENPRETSQLDQHKKETEFAAEIATAAVESLNAKGGPKSSPLRKFKIALRTFSSNSFLRLCFRIFLALASANISGILIVRWSLNELKKFPSPDQTSTFPNQFPIWGDCSPEVFLILLIDSMVVTSLIGFWLARRIELFLGD